MTAAFTWNGNSSDEDFLNLSSGGIDIVYAMGGNDRIIEDYDPNLWSNDRFYGGNGDDVIKSRSGFDELFGQAGNDLLVVRASSYDSAHIPGMPGDPNQPPVWEGFDVSVDGGEGYDVLEIRHAETWDIEEGPNGVVRVTLNTGGVITARDIEEITFVL